MGQTPLYTLVLLLVAGFSLQAQDMAEDSIPRVYDMPQIQVVQVRDGLFARTPGSVAYLSSARMRKLAPISGNEVFRTIPGVHVNDEEGAGLRMNLGIRGLDPDRSRGVLVLEDGLPVALAPYGEPEMYYTPAIERMSGVELVKGSGQILFGPQTIGGVLNYITADPPADPEGFLRLQAGQGGMLHAHAGYGNTVENVGYQVNYLFKRADQLAYAGYRVQDLNGKFRMQISPASSLGLKLAVYDEWSDATYIGLTQTMYDRGGEDFVRMAPNDQLNIRRYAGSLTHAWKPDARTEWKNVLFGYTTTRNWQRQDFSSNPAAANQTGVIWGDPQVPGGAVFMQDQVGHRNRQFEVSGLDSRMQRSHRWLGMDQQTDFGIRALYEKALEQRVNGRGSDAASGALVEDEARTGRALSAYLQNRWELGRFVQVTAGLRGEWFHYERVIFRNAFGGVITDTLVRANNEVAMLIPGLGVNVGLAPDWTLFAGLHRGFAPPRVKDAITRVGEALDLDAEKSWNSELGLRRAAADSWSFETTAFFMDFSNQIIPVSESSGGTGAGLVNGGATRHYGLEVGLGLQMGHWLGARHQLDLYSATTLLRAHYSADRFIASGGESVNIRGNRTPYAPEFMQSATLSYAWDGKVGINLHLLMTGAQFGDELNTVAPAADGRNGRIDGYRVLDANAFYQFQRVPLRLGFSVKNITDERYIVTRRPQGIRLGLPRFLSGTLEFRF